MRRPDGLPAGRSIGAVMRRHWTRRMLASTLSVAAVTLAMVGFPAAATAGDTPAGFYYGTDGNGINNSGPTGSSVPYKEPSPCTGDFGSYVGRIESFPDSANHEAWSNDADENAYSNDGVGSQNYYVLSGPGSMSASEATTWGMDQGETALDNFYDFYNQNGADLPLWPIIYADLETGGGNWTSNTSLNRDVFNGFWDVVEETDMSIGGDTVLIFAGAYSTDDWWSEYMSGNLNGTIEWTAQTSTSTPEACASNFSTSSTVAHFFAGYGTGSQCAVAWQWVSSNPQDWDQVDAARMESDISNVLCN
jgi:hypothetical protein